MMRARAGSVAAAILVLSLPAQAVISPPAAPPPSDSAAPPDDSAEPRTCKETFPTGSERPSVVESFPDRGQSGHALVLDVVVAHGKGESILPSGVGAESSAEASKLLEAAGFFLPSAKGPSAPALETTTDGVRGRSHLTISVVALPKKPGRVELTLPPLPIAMVRASGEVRTLCTKPHTVTVEDPIANTPDARPKGNPRPLRQREEWTAAKYATFGALGALVAALLAAWVVGFYKRRPKAVPPPPPPRPPWEVAMEELFDVRVAQLVEQGRFAEHFDRVSDAVRRYLGARYGFDGLETTTREALAALRRVVPRIVVFSDVDDFLQNADLVKFAKLTPTEAECHAALGSAEEIVRRTVPLPSPPPLAADGRPAGAWQPPPAPPAMRSAPIPDAPRPSATTTPVVAPRSAPAPSIQSPYSPESPYAPKGPAPIPSPYSPESPYAPPPPGPTPPVAPEKPPGSSEDPSSGGRNQ